MLYTNGCAEDVVLCTGEVTGAAVAGEAAVCRAPSSSNAGSIRGHVAALAVGAVVEHNGIGAGDPQQIGEGVAAVASYLEIGGSPDLCLNGCALVVDDGGIVLPSCVCIQCVRDIFSI